MRPITLTLNLDNASATKVAAAQTLSGAGNFTLAAGASAIDSSTAARYILMTCAANETSRTFTITGRDADGNSISETIAGVNATTALTTKAYASISQIASDGATAGNVSWGTGNATKVALSKTIPTNFYARIAAQVALEITGTISVSVQETFDDILGSGTANATFMAAPSGLTTQTATTHSQADVGVTGIQVKINSYTNSATLTARIIHPSNSDAG